MNEICEICGLPVTYNDRWGWRHIIYIDGVRRVRGYVDEPYRHNAYEGVAQVAHKYKW